jgi:REP element-mobilizing transposase RayT
MNEANFNISLNGLHVAIERTSLDKANDEYMTHSQMEVINFDLLKKRYLKNNKVSDNSYLSSCDAVYTHNDEIYLIEFKNGKLNGDNNELRDIRKKISESLLTLLAVIEEDMPFCKNHIHFILVYNAKKNGVEETEELITDLAKSESVYFGLEGFQRLWFKSVHTYSEMMFNEKFIRIYENQ